MKAEMKPSGRFDSARKSLQMVAGLEIFFSVVLMLLSSLKFGEGVIVIALAIIQYFLGDALGCVSSYLKSKEEV